MPTYDRIRNSFGHFSDHPTNDSTTRESQTYDGMVSIKIRSTQDSSLSKEDYIRQTREALGIKQ